MENDESNANTEQEVRQVVKVKDMLHENSRNGSPKRMRVPRNNLQTIDAQNRTAADIGDAGSREAQGRFRQRSRTPNQSNTILVEKRNSQASLLPPRALGGPKRSMPRNATMNQTIQSTSSINKGPRSYLSRDNSNMRNNQLSQRNTVDSTVTNTNATVKTSAPGPGSYNYKPMFPKGPKYVIQSKSRADSLIQTKISQNISPGPAKYSKRGPVGGTHQTISIRTKEKQDETTASDFERVGPGAYNTNSIGHLKRSARITIGNTKRTLMVEDKNPVTPGPDIYNPHKTMTQPRSNSRERNAYRATIGLEKKEKPLSRETPGPSNYNTESRVEIGDAASVKVPFTTAQRPISAHPGRTKKIQVIPGPQDYNPVEVDKYRKRRSVIPSFLFSTSSKNLEIEPKQEKRAKSPGPNQYRPQSAYVLSNQPRATIGNTKREISEKHLSKNRFERAKSPGPSDYKIDRSLSKGDGQKFPMAQRYIKMIKQYGIPGPSSYQYDPIANLKKSSRATIGNYKQMSVLATREKSPGPQDYEPKRLNWKKRAVAVRFNREKRQGILRDAIGVKGSGFVSPGPGSYMLPCKFYEKPRYASGVRDKFRFV